MTELSPFQTESVRIAHILVDIGCPVFTMFADTLRGEFLFRDDWQHSKPSHAAVDRWKPGMAMCMVTGVVLDVLDVDPRNGGEAGWDELLAASAVPDVYASSRTPSEGGHHFIARTFLAKTSKAARGVDLQAGAPDGSGRGFVYLPPTVRISRHGTHEGLPRPYEWVVPPDGASVVEDSGARMTNLRLLVASNRGGRRPAPSTAVDAAVDDDIAAFADMASDAWTPEQADRVITGQCQAVRAARDGQINNALGGAARVLGRFVAGGYITEDDAFGRLTDALAAGGVHSDDWNIANGKGWTAATVIGAGLANGAREPWTVEMAETPAVLRSAGVSGTDPGLTRGQSSAPVPVSTPGTRPGPASVESRTDATSTIAAPRLLITSPADMAYWLQSALGSAGLSGYFLRNGHIVHTPRVDESGYVPPRADEDFNGPAQIQPITPGQLGAKIQYAFHCYKEVDQKDEAGKKTGQKVEVPALFPLEAAKRAVDAPEAMVMLRGLRGITLTPMVRADGSILADPGYDRETGYLFLPGPGVKVPEVPAAPEAAQVAEAVSVLTEMTAGFPWDSQDDRANYYGMLLTPLLRLLAPPSYKLFGITAHQPGSGKTLLADVARIIHGGVLRSEMPDDEAEISKMTTSILATTSAPVVHVDNVTGVLKSSKLAGLLTADGEIQERELGKTSNLTFVNDRLWVVTGNNLSLGGDLIRRTVVIGIDPNMANPQERLFDIPDLKAWATQHRNRLLWALLVMVRAWVAAGSPEEVRKQSDSFARWEAVVGGILAACGVPGRFDADSGRKAAGGGDDDGLAAVLERVWSARQGLDWSVAEILSDTQGTDLGDFVAESREWLPSPVLDKLARSEAGGRKTFGIWLRNRLGRWVSGTDGHSYVLREGHRDKMGARWKIERSG